MPLPIFNSERRKLDQVISIDLGSRSTKAVHVQRKGDAYTLFRHAIMDAPLFEKVLSVDMLTEHLKAVHQSFETKLKAISISVGANDSILRQADMPMIPVEDMRQVLKNSPKTYLQQDLTGYLFDCWILSPARKQSPVAVDPTKAVVQQKHRVLVGGARRQLVDDLTKAAKAAGLVVDQIIPGLVGPINAFEIAMPDSFAKEAVALVDIGFKNTSIGLVFGGELLVHRVVGIGGEKLTAGLAEAMGISFAEAESLKLGMPGEVQMHLEPLLSSLARELRASIDFFEHQQDKTISRVYVSGGSARADFVVKGLESDMMAACCSWNPGATMQLSLPPTQAAEFEAVSPQLAVAIGGAVSTLS